MNDETKPTCKGILWRLNAEEKEALREVCEYAEMAADDFGPVSTERIGMLTRQLLGEGE